MEQLIFSSVEIRPKATNSGGLRWLCLKKFYRTAIILLCGLTYGRAIIPHIFQKLFPSQSGKRLSGLRCWRRLCRHKVTVDEPLTPYDRITPMGNCGTPRIGNASEDWQRLR